MKEVDSSDKKILKRINKLIKDILRNKYEGIGKPEPLKNNLSGYWSRRINVEHRLVYKIEKERIMIAQCRLFSNMPTGVKADVP